MRLSPTNPMRSSLMSALIFEVIVFWLAFAGMIQVSGADVVVAVVATGLASLACIVAAAGLRRGWGYPVGHLAQLAAIALGLLTPWMYAMGAVFAIIWAMAFIMGTKLEAHHAVVANKE